MKFKWAAAALISVILLAGRAGGAVGARISAPAPGGAYSLPSILAEPGTNADFAETA